MKYFIILFILFNISCTSGSKNYQDSLTIERVDEIVLKVRDCTIVNPSNTRLIESDSGRYLFAYNHVEKNLHFINFSDGRVALKVPLTYDGPNSAQQAMGFTLIGMDSVLVTFNPPAIALVNFKGEVIWKKKINDDLSSLMTIITSTTKPILKNGSNLFGPQPFFMDHLGMEASDILKQRLVFSLNLDSGNISWHDVFYNSNYWEHGKKPSDFSWDHRADYIYIAPLYDHEIIIFDTNTMEIVMRKDIGSDYINDFQYANERAPDGATSLQNKLTHDKYGPFIYDKYRNIFYRFFLPGYRLQEDLSLEELRPLNRSRGNSGVMVLDSNLNILGEHLFEEFEIHPEMNMFVGKQGLYLSLNNENHPEYTDDHFRYMLVTFNLED